MNELHLLVTTVIYISKQNNDRSTNSFIQELQNVWPQTLVLVLHHKYGQDTTSISYTANYMYGNFQVMRDKEGEEEEQRR